MQPRPAEDRLEPNTGGRNPTLPAGSPQRSLQLWPSQAGGLSWSRRDRQDSASIRMRQTTGPTALEGFQKRGVVLAQEGAELVGDLLAVPDGILLSARQYGDGLG
jgi:hypothetical protein